MRPYQAGLLPKPCHLHPRKRQELECIQQENRGPLLPEPERTGLLWLQGDCCTSFAKQDCGHSSGDLDSWGR
ncbi:hypothetical protein P7K49_008958 [Saguinus oedipus]|uniref:Uncharacterized protein n=1 Tax=Saguinus oedipus TaxID=9490 RepID=A0ABQ9VZ74_SAGOE|nr:hypothetical protein P7K49_008958 [Saguinus oedipus]